MCNALIFHLYHVFYSTMVRGEILDFRLSKIPLVFFLAISFDFSSISFLSVGNIFNLLRCELLQLIAQIHNIFAEEKSPSGFWVNHCGLALGNSDWN
jgi:hypothetical protein